MKWQAYDIWLHLVLRDNFWEGKRWILIKNERTKGIIKIFIQWLINKEPVFNWDTFLTGPARVGQKKYCDNKYWKITWDMVGGAFPPFWELAQWGVVFDVSLFSYIFLTIALLNVSIFYFSFEFFDAECYDRLLWLAALIFLFLTNLLNFWMENSFQ